MADLNIDISDMVRGVQERVLPEESERRQRARRAG
jgi:hypothetical protein